jgi:solute carrier family 35 protein C2
MCKSSTLAFVLIFAFLFKLEKPRLKLIAIIVIITAGVLLMVSNETDFVVAG